MGRHDRHQLSLGLRGYGNKPEDSEDAALTAAAARQISRNKQVEAAVEDMEGNPEEAAKLRRLAVQADHIGRRATQIDWLRNQ